MSTIKSKEPVVSTATISGIITSIIALLIAFGLDLTNEQVAALVGLAPIVATAVTAVVARRLVWPEESVAEVARLAEDAGYAKAVEDLTATDGREV